MGKGCCGSVWVQQQKLSCHGTLPQPLLGSWSPGEDQVQRCYQETQKALCTVWYTRYVYLGQWATIFIRRIQDLQPRIGIRTCHVEYRIYAQSNRMTESAVKSANGLTNNAKASRGTDPWLTVLDHRNTPIDRVYRQQSSTTPDEQTYQDSSTNTSQ